MTLLKKNCITIIIILIVIHLVLATGLICILQDFIIKQDEQALIKYCKTICESYSKLYEANSLQNNDFHEIEYEIKTLDKYTDMNFIMVDKEFKVLISSDNSNLNIGDEIEDSSFKNVIQNKIIITENGMHNIFDEQVFSVAYPIKIWNNVVGAIIVSKSVPLLYSNIKQIAVLITFCLIISCAISTFVMYLFTKKLIEPIKKISNVAKFFADGNFEKRIEAKSTDEIGTLIKSLNNMADRLENQEKIRTKFIANISHDLRSPLTSINGFLQALCDGIIKEDKRAYYLDIVYSETKRLRKLVDNILDITKVSNKEVKLNKSVNNINDLIEHIIKTMSHRLETKNITIEKNFESENCIASFDYGKIHRVLYNLIDNAYKFTPDNGKIELTVSSGVDKNKYYISVKDSGIGIKKEDQKNIFDRFYKSDASRNMDKTGSGLGLSIVKEFINEHGETLELHSEQNKGCEFVFTLEKAQENQIKE